MAPPLAWIHVEENPRNRSVTTHARRVLTRKEELRHRITSALHMDTGPRIGLVNESRACHWEALEPTCLPKSIKDP